MDVANRCYYVQNFPPSVGVSKLSNIMKEITKWAKRNEYVILNMETYDHPVYSELGVRVFYYRIEH